MLRALQKLPTARQAAFGSAPESRMAGGRYAMAEQLERDHAPDALPDFLMRHGHAAEACELMISPRGGAAGTPGGSRREAGPSRHTSFPTVNYIFG